MFAGLESTGKQEQMLVKSVHASLAIYCQQIRSRENIVDLECSFSYDVWFILIHTHLDLPVLVAFYLKKKPKTYLLK